MKKVYLFIFILFSAFALNAQTTIDSISFSDGGSGWDLEESQSLTDQWTVNNSYDCTPDYGMTPNRNGGNYLHIRIDDFLGIGGECANAYGSGGASGTIYASMTSGVNTTGFDTVTISFWWMGKGYSQLGIESFGTVEYSTNGGGSWSQFTTPKNKYSSQSTWTKAVISSASYPQLLNQTNLRLRFSWINGGMSSDPSFAIDDILIVGNKTNVNACNNVGGTATANPTTICTNQTSTINLTGQTGTIQWQQSANGTTGWANVAGGTGATTTSYTTAALASTTYFRAAVSQATCPDQFSNTVSIGIVSGSTPSVSFNVSPSAIVCSGDNVLFTPSATNGGSDPKYIWKVNNNFVSGSSTFSSSTLATNDIVECRMVSNIACAFPSDTSGPYRVTMTVNAAPDTIITVTGSTSFCSGDSVQLTAPVGDTYNWSTGQHTASIFAKSNDSYTVTVTDNPNCSATSKAVTVTVYHAPAVPIVQPSGSLLSTTSIASSYQWYYNGDTIGGATGQTIIPKKSGNYAVRVYDIHGCNNISADYPFVVTGIENIEDGELSIYPNPSNGKWHMTANNSIVGSIYQISDVEGRLILTSEIRDPKSEINLSVQPGIYFLQVYSPVGNITRKLVKL